MVMNIYIGNLSYATTGDQLKTMFADFGEVQEAKIILDRRTQLSKGFGFVEMPSNSEADQAIKALNGRLVDGRNIKVNPADSGRKKNRRRTSKRRRFSAY
jgi:RNA recognition motif-containing protein